MSRGPTDAGAATIMALAIVSVLVLVAAGMAAGGRLLAAHVQATAAADAGALAAAPLTFLAGDPHQEAVRYVSQNGANLVRCICRKDVSFRVRVITVEVSKPAELPLFGALTVRARAAAEFDPMDLIR